MITSYLTDQDYISQTGGGWGDWVAVCRERRRLVHVLENRRYANNLSVLPCSPHRELARIHENATRQIYYQLT